MQGEEYSNCQLGQLQPSYELFDELFPQEDCKVVEILPQCLTLASVDDSVPKKKGRPKGEKNSTLVRKRNKSEKGEGKHRGHWLLSENKRYHLFLEVHHKHFICKEMRRLDKIFKTMSTFVGTRQAQQCRSHHQKMQKKFHSFTAILLYLRKQHFGSEDPEFIRCQLRNEYEDLPYILEADQLHDLGRNDQGKKQKQPVLKEIESPLTSSIKEQSSQVSFQKMLDDDYEHQFGLQFLL